MSRCMTLAAALFDRQRTPSTIAVSRDTSGHTMIDEAGTITPGQMHRAQAMIDGLTPHQRVFYSAMPGPRRPRISIRTWGRDHVLEDIYR
jgi:hypothetical protein